MSIVARKNVLKQKFCDHVWNETSMKNCDQQRIHKSELYPQKMGNGMNASAKNNECTKWQITYRRLASILQFENARHRSPTESRRSPRCPSFRHRNWAHVLSLFASAINSWQRMNELRPYVNIGGRFFAQSKSVPFIMNSNQQLVCALCWEQS